MVFVVAVTMFSRWVVLSERRSEARASADPVGAPAIGMLAGASVRDVADPSSPVDASARRAARGALDAARRAMHGKGTPADAGPGLLGTPRDGLIVTDGASSAPIVVSVAIEGRRWSAAVMGASGTCYWVSLGPAGARFGDGTPCTGVAALDARERRWG